MSNVVEVTLPRGRIVSGHPMKMVDSIDFYTKQPKMGKDGQPMKECFIQVAVSKQDPDLPAVWQAMMNAAGRQIPANPDQDQFAWKITDGDGFRLDKQGQQVPYPEHSHGCWLFNVKSHGWAPKVVYNDGSGFNEIMDPAAIKCGDYVYCGLKLEANGAVGQQAGIYMNPTLVLFAEPGQEIQTGGGKTVADADSIFGNVAGGTVPPTPAAPTQTAPAGVPAMPGAAAPMPPTASPSNPQQPMAPAHDFVQNAGQPAQQPMAPMPGMPQQ